MCELKPQSRVIYLKAELAMLIKKPEDIKGSEITPKSIYAQRRKFLQLSLIHI